MARAGVACVMLAVACSHSGTPGAVHLGNLVEVGGAPGDVAATVGAASFTLPSFAYQGKTVVAVPLFAKPGWTLTLKAQGGAAHTLHVVDNPQPGKPGDATLQLLDLAAALDQSVHAPVEADKAAAYQQSLADLKTLAADLRPLIVQAQSAPVAVMSGASIDADVLGVLDRAVAGAQEPVVPLGAQPAAQALSSGSVAVGAIFTVGVAASAAYAVPGAALTAAGAGLLFGGSLSAAALVFVSAGNVIGASDFPDLSSAAQWGPLRALWSQALDGLSAAVTVPVLTQDITRTTGDVGTAVFCDTKTCANCLRGCGRSWNGCFPADTFCCGFGGGAALCFTGLACFSCNGNPTCLAPGQNCPPCTPDCAGKQCGPDGCGYSCGGCAAGTKCSGSACVACTADCSGKTCGDDGCNGSCGSCGSGDRCVAGNCCTPNCPPASCGDDGCGGTCACGNSTDRCIAGSCCSPVCPQGYCGDDGCGGTCTCPGGVCQGSSCCFPSCTNKQCGDDGCGGSCGTCPSGTCSNGVCVAQGACGDENQPCCAGSTCNQDYLGCHSGTCTPKICNMTCCCGPACAPGIGPLSPGQTCNDCLAIGNPHCSCGACCTLNSCQ